MVRVQNLEIVQHKIKEHQELKMITDREDKNMM